VGTFFETQGTSVKRLKLETSNLVYGLTTKSTIEKCKSKGQKGMAWVT